jgi:hypothetical protein
VVLACSIPISAALDNILLAVVLFFWLAGGGYRDKLAAIRGNPVAWMFVALFALFVAGSAYSIGTAKDVQDALIRALRLLLVPALVYLLRGRSGGSAASRRSLGDARDTRPVLARVARRPPGGGWMKGMRLDPVVWKSHITQNVFMASQPFCWRSARMTRRRGEAGSSTVRFCAAAMANVLLMVPGRTGSSFCSCSSSIFSPGLGARGLAIAGVVLVAFAAIVLASPDSMLHRRVTLADEEFTQWRAGVPPEPTSSVGCASNS